MNEEARAKVAEERMLQHALAGLAARDRLYDVGRRRWENRVQPTEDAAQLLADFEPRPSWIFAIACAGVVGAFVVVAVLDRGERADWLAVIVSVSALLVATVAAWMQVATHAVERRARAMTAYVLNEFTAQRRHGRSDPAIGVHLESQLDVDAAQLLVAQSLAGSMLQADFSDSRAPEVWCDFSLRRGRDHG